MGMGFAPTWLPQVRVSTRCFTWPL